MRWPALGWPVASWLPWLVRWEQQHKRELPVVSLYLQGKLRFLKRFRMRLLQGHNRANTQLYLLSSSDPAHPVLAQSAPSHPEEASCSASLWASRQKKGKRRGNEGVPKIKPAGASKSWEPLEKKNNKRRTVVGDVSAFCAPLLFFTVMIKMSFIELMKES